MRQLTFDMQPEGWDQPLTVKTPDDIYRIEVRVTFHPDSGRSVAAVETTHEHTRELISWKMLPMVESHDSLVHRELLSAALGEAMARQWELLEPF